MNESNLTIASSSHLHLFHQKSQFTFLRAQSRVSSGCLLDYINKQSSFLSAPSDGYRREAAIGNLSRAVFLCVG